MAVGPAGRMGGSSDALPVPSNSALLFSLVLLPVKFPSQAKSFHLWTWPQSEILWKLSAEFI